MNPAECMSSSPSPDSPFPPPATLRQLSDADKLRKVICELVETERTYVKVSASTSVRPDGLRLLSASKQYLYSTWLIHIYGRVLGAGDAAVRLPGHCPISLHYERGRVVISRLERVYNRIMSELSKM